MFWKSRKRIRIVGNELRIQLTEHQATELKRQVQNGVDLGKVIDDAFRFFLRGMQLAKAGQRTGEIACFALVSPDTPLETKIPEVMEI